MSVSASNIISLPVRGAYKTPEAAAYLGISVKTLWRLASLKKIRRTSYGTYPKSELDRHLAEELKEAEEND